MRRTEMAKETVITPRNREAETLDAGSFLRFSVAPCKTVASVFSVPLPPLPPHRTLAHTLPFLLPDGAGFGRAHLNISI
jgi:hypothetical protein